MYKIYPVYVHSSVLKVVLSLSARIREHAGRSEGFFFAFCSCISFYLISFVVPSFKHRLFAPFFTCAVPAYKETPIFSALSKESFLIVSSDVRSLFSSDIQPDTFLSYSPFSEFQTEPCISLQDAQIFLTFRRRLFSFFVLSPPHRSRCLPRRLLLRLRPLLSAPSSLLVLLRLPLLLLSLRQLAASLAVSEQLATTPQRLAMRAAIRPRVCLLEKKQGEMGITITIKKRLSHRSPQAPRHRHQISLRLHIFLIPLLLLPQVQKPVREKAVAAA